MSLVAEKTPERYKRRSRSFYLVILFGVSLSACNNTCFVFTSNSFGGTLHVKVSDPPPTCTLTKANGAVSVQLRAEPQCDLCAGSGQIQHIFLTLRSIAIHPSLAADDNSPDWQELLSAEVSRQPLEVDLVGDDGDRVAGKPFADQVAIPAGVYSQLRLRLMPDQPTVENRAPERNGCGDAALNCVVTADGRIHPLMFDGLAPELRITADKPEGGPFVIPPESHTDLIIELTPAWRWFSSPGEGIRLVPAITAKAKIERRDNE